MTQRQLSEEEKHIYERSLKRQLEEKDSLTFSIKFEQLMQDEGYMHNYKEKIKWSKAQLEGLKGELEACNLAISDCEEKLKDGVTIKEEN